MTKGNLNLGIMDNGMFIGTRGILDKSRGKVHGKRKPFSGEVVAYSVEVMGEIIKVKCTNSVI